MVTQTVTLPQGRLAYYDRNTTQTSLNNETLAAAPHAPVTRATYTVPSARKALITSTHIEASRETAATTLGRVRILIGGSFGGAATVTMFENAVGARVVGDPSGGESAIAGLQITIQDEDTSTAGTVSFEEQVSVIEFDA